MVFTSRPASATPFPTHPVDLVDRQPPGAPPGVVVAGILAGLPRRLAHVRAVAAKAERISDRLDNPAERQLLVDSAWFHDVGYAAPLVETGFHPIDGARWLFHVGGSDRLCGLVAHHSCAEVEAGLRGLADVIAHFDNERSDLTALLACCDLTTGPGGEDMGLDERLADIRSRYGQDHVVCQAWRTAEPVARELFTRVGHTGQLGWP